MTKVFIDGSAGTTGLRIHERLSGREGLELIALPPELRKDAKAREEAINAADIAFFCLPDAAAVEAAGLVHGNTRVIDTSTAHRTDPAWAYGFAELAGKRAQIESAQLVANPGCHASGFISLVEPLVREGLIAADTALTCFSVTGYSGGGKAMIADYEAAGRSSELDAPRQYALGQSHKHIPEMVKVCGLATAPIFCPVVDDYFKGMASTVPLHAAMLKGSAGPDAVREALSDFYGGSALISVAPAEECAAAGKLYGNALAGRDSLRIFVEGNDARITVTALFDNLGKGASGAAIQNMNLALGLPEATGLVL